MAKWIVSVSARAGWQLAGICVVAALGSWGCGDDQENWPAGRPRIDHLKYLQQSPRDPLAFQFLLEFTDSDADLGEGFVLLRVDRRSVAELPLADLFSTQSPPLPLTSVEGAFEVVARIGRAVDVGDRIRLGFRLRDAGGRESNEPSVVLRAASASQ